MVGLKEAADGREGNLRDYSQRRYTVMLYLGGSKWRVPACFCPLIPPNAYYPERGSPGSWFYNP